MVWNYLCIPKLQPCNLNRFPSKFLQLSVILCHFCGPENLIQNGWWNFIRHILQVHLQLRYLLHTSTGDTRVCHTFIMSFITIYALYIAVFYLALYIVIALYLNCYSFLPTLILTFTPNIVTVHTDGLMQERRNSIANALELRLSCTNTSISPHTLYLAVSISPMCEDNWKLETTITCLFCCL